MQIAAKHGVLTLIGLFISLPLVFWIAPTTGEGTTLLVIIVLLATNTIGGVRRHPPVVGLPITNEHRPSKKPMPFARWPGPATGRADPGLCPIGAEAHPEVPDG